MLVCENQCFRALVSRFRLVGENSGQGRLKICGSTLVYRLYKHSTLHHTWIRFVIITPIVSDLGGEPESLNNTQLCAQFNVPIKMGSLYKNCSPYIRFRLNFLQRLRNQARFDLWWNRIVSVSVSWTFYYLERNPKGK